MTRKAAHRASLRSVSGREPSRSGLAAPPKPERPRRSLEWLARSVLRKQQPHAPALAAASDRCGEAVAAARCASKCFDDSFQSQYIWLARLEAVQRRLALRQLGLQAWSASGAPRRAALRELALEQNGGDVDGSHSHASSDHVLARHGVAHPFVDVLVAARLRAGMLWFGHTPSEPLGRDEPTRPLRARLSPSSPCPCRRIDTRSCGARMACKMGERLKMQLLGPGRRPDGSEHGDFAAPRAGGRGAA